MISILFLIYTKELLKNLFKCIFNVQVNKLPPISVVNEETKNITD